MVAYHWLLSTASTAVPECIHIWVAIKGTHMQNMYTADLLPTISRCKQCAYICPCPISSEKKFNGQCTSEEGQLLLTVVVSTPDNHKMRRLHMSTTSITHHSTFCTPCA